MQWSPVFPEINQLRTEEIQNGYSQKALIPRSLEANRKINRHTSWKWNPNRLLWLTELICSRMTRKQQRLMRQNSWESQKAIERFALWQGLGSLPDAQQACPPSWKPSRYRSHTSPDCFRDEILYFWNSVMKWSDHSCYRTGLPRSFRSTFELP